MLLILVSCKHTSVITPNTDTELVIVYIDICYQRVLTKALLDSDSTNGIIENIQILQIRQILT